MDGGYGLFTRILQWKIGQSIVWPKERLAAYTKLENIPEIIEIERRYVYFDYNQVIHVEELENEERLIFIRI